MTATADMQEFCTLLDSLRTGAANEALSRLQHRSWERYQQLGLPTKRTETYKYVRLSKLYDNLYAPATGESSTKQAPIPTTIATVNGRLCEKASNIEPLTQAGVVVLPLEQAASSYNTFLQNRWAQLAKKENDPFAALNGALCQGGVFIYIPPGVIVEEPIHLEQQHSPTDTASVSTPRVHLFAGRGAQATIVANSTASNEQQWTNGLTDLSLDDAATISFYDLGGAETASSWNLQALRAQLKRDCVLNIVSLAAGSATSRADYRIELQGENSEANLSALWMLRDRRECHGNVLMEHHAPHCRSMQLFKSAVLDSARSSFEGKIFVDPIAQKTDAFQLNNNLLLGERAQANSKPNLEIFADDVKASHGSTVGQLNADELFYLQTRGYSREAAQKVLVKAFCQDVLEKVEHEETRNAMAKRLEGLLP